MLDYIPKKKFSSIDRDIITRTLYDELWGLHDHSRDDNPLSQVLLFEQESLFGNGNTIENRLKIYIESEVSRFTGMTFPEYMNLPRHYQDIIIKVCNESKVAKSKKLDSIEKELNDLGKDL